ncbi:DUF397 domain-containing protein [Streptomyces sp. NPDC048290]|uniref:DUF397 domain-containing protein n=1 Tax=Streptomyces sp. NPDC048290 TaxID=3155811 RepID=UPI0034386ECF
MTTTTLKWFKSSYSENEISDCVEVANTPRTIHVRDSKRIDGDQLTFHRDHWTTFLKYASASS